MKYDVKNRIVSAMLVVVMLVLWIPFGTVTVNATSYITSTSSAKGSNYTSSATMANKLDAIFSGDIDIYSNSGCTNELSMPVGTSMSTEKQYYVKSKTT